MQQPDGYHPPGCLFLGAMCASVFAPALVSAPRCMNRFGMYQFFSLFNPLYSRAQNLKDTSR